MSESPAADEPLLSVVSITYNHERYIRAALDGFVAQETPFPFEVIVADDASTDGTVEIIKEYRESHPDIVRPILRPENVGIHANLVGALNAARGKYIALCEGDDYWTDPLKLSKQVAHLESNPDVSLCFHPVRVTWEDGVAEDAVFPPDDFPEDAMTFRRLVSSNFVQTNSAVYRNRGSYDDVPDVMPLDWYLHVLHAAEGRIAMLPETMSVYRRHADGVWAGSVVDRERFLITRGPGHMDLYQAMIDLRPDDEEVRRQIGAAAVERYTDFAQLPSPHDAEATEDAVGRSTTVAALAIQRQQLEIRRREERMGEIEVELKASNAALEANAAEVARLLQVETELREHIGRQKARIAQQRARIDRQRGKIDRQRERVNHLRAELEAARIERERRLSFRIRRFGGRIRRATRRALSPGR